MSTSTVQTVSQVTKMAEFSLTFDVKPLGAKSGWTNILHVGSATSGSRYPSVYFYGNEMRLHVSYGETGFVSANQISAMQAGSVHSVAISVRGGSLYLAVDDVL